MLWQWVPLDPLLLGQIKSFVCYFFYETFSGGPYNLWSYNARIDDNDNNEGFAYLPL